MRLTTEAEGVVNAVRTTQQTNGFIFSWKVD